MEIEKGRASYTEIDSTKERVRERDERRWRRRREREGGREGKSGLAALSSRVVRPAILDSRALERPEVEVVFIKR